MVDAATQRTNMVESQVLTSDVTDKRILRAMRELPRERFVPAPMAALAYMDEAVPLSPPGQYPARLGHKIAKTTPCKVEWVPARSTHAACVWGTRWSVVTAQPNLILL